MFSVRSLFLVCTNAVLVAGVVLPGAGCDSQTTGTSAPVSVDFQKKTANMLEQKSKDQMAKYKNSGANRR
jgi:hypothetical protein